MTNRTPYGNDTLIVPAFFTTDTNQAECEAWKRDHPTWFVAGTWTPGPRRRAEAPPAPAALPEPTPVEPSTPGPATSPLDRIVDQLSARWAAESKSVAPRARDWDAAAARDEGVTQAQYRGGGRGPTRLPGGGMADLTPGQELLVARLNFALQTIRRLEPRNSWGYSLSPANQVPSEAAVGRVEAEAEAAVRRSERSALTSDNSRRPSRLEFEDWDQASPALRALRQNMVKAGEMVEGDLREAHHIVPQGGAGMTGDRDPSRAQAVLRKFGIDLNSRENGVALSRNFHRSIHTGDYYREMNVRLENAQTREEALNVLKEMKEALVQQDIVP